MLLIFRTVDYYISSFKQDQTGLYLYYTLSINFPRGRLEAKIEDKINNIDSSICICFFFTIYHQFQLPIFTIYFSCTVAYITKGETYVTYYTASTAYSLQVALHI